MNFNELIEKFNNNSPHLNLECDEVGVVRFFVGDEHLIYMRGNLDDSFFFLYASAGNLPKTNEEKAILYQKLLEANLFGDGVGLACLAIHQESDKIILTQTFDMQYTDYYAFEAAYKSFLRHLNYWSNDLRN